jgi:transposase InsO family protein
VRAVCGKLEMSRQNYYARRQERQRRRVNEDLVVKLVQRERAVQPRIGGRKLRVILKKDLTKAGVKVGRDRFFEVLRGRGLLVPPPRAEFPRTTQSRHCLPVFGNRIKDLDLRRPNQAWVSDLTYLRSEEGFLYLALITDRVSRKIVGYHCGDTLETVGCLEALEGALAELPRGAKPMHHSDRGTQYCSHEYVKRLREAGLEVSMTEGDHCAQNALAERVNGILKTEYGLGREFKTKAEVRAAVDQGVMLYNTRRPHTALQFKVPEEVHSLAE